LDERQGRKPTDALARAVGLLARREHSQRELVRKLEQRGFAEADIDAALRRLQGEGLQDDTRFAEMLVRSRIAAGQGPLRIRAELVTHGLGDGAIEAALAAEPVDWLEAAQRAIARRFDLDDPQQRRKAIEFLLRRGFTLDTARAAAAPP